MSYFTISKFEATNEVSKKGVKIKAHSTTDFNSSFFIEFWCPDTDLVTRLILGEQSASFELLDYLVEQVTEIECPDCNGEGEESELTGCDKPSSMCCGGCSVMVDCETCAGSGVIEEVEFDY